MTGHTHNPTRYSFGVVNLLSNFQRSFTHRSGYLRVNLTHGEGAVGKQPRNQIFPTPQYGPPADVFFFVSFSFFFCDSNIDNDTLRETRSKTVGGVSPARMHILSGIHTVSPYTVNVVARLRYSRDQRHNIKTRRKTVVVPLVFGPVSLLLCFA